MMAALNRRADTGPHFWRDVAGHEINIVLQSGFEFVTVEVKSGETISADCTKGIEFWRTLSGQENAPAAVVYGGAVALLRSGTASYSWRDWI